MIGSREKVVAITGASSGIGRAVARMLAERGARVVLGARGSDRLEETAQRIRDDGGAAVSRLTDVTRPDDLQELVQLGLQEFGRLDVLISNAGVMPVSPLDDLRVADWNLMIDVHIKGLLNGIAATLPVFRRQGHGHFVSTSSVAGLRTSPTMAVYAATKAAVREINEGLRQEAGGDLRVTTVTPGFTATNFGISITDEKVRARLTSTADKIAVLPEAVAGAMVYAIEQPPDVDVNEVVIRPTAQA